VNLAEVLDAAILTWLIFTWFFEGHHKRCSVELKCPNCGMTSDVHCQADRRAPKADGT
jgi:hypothetical protein